MRHMLFVLLIIFLLHQKKCFAKVFISRKNHLSHNEPLISSFTSTHHWGHRSQSEPSFQTNVHEPQPEFWQGRPGAVSRPELSCLLAGRCVCSCKSHQIRNHRTGKRPVESQSSTAGLTLPCVIQIWRECGRSSWQLQSLLQKSKNFGLTDTRERGFLGKLVQPASKWLTQSQTGNIRARVGHCGFFCFLCYGYNKENNWLNFVTSDK